MTLIIASHKHTIKKRLAILLLLMVGLLTVAPTSISLPARAITTPTPQVLTIAQAGHFEGSEPKRPPLLRLPNVSFDPLQGEPPIAPALRSKSLADNMTPQHWLVQMQPAQLISGVAAVKQAGGLIVAPIADWAYIVTMDERSAAQVRQLAAIRWVGHYQPAYKIAACSFQIADCGYQGMLDLKVKLFSDAAVANQAAATTIIETRLQNMGFSVQQVSADTLLVRTSATRLSELAADEAVRYVERQPLAHLLNDRMRAISSANVVAGYLGLYGAGQTIAIADTGLDSGNLASLSADFRGRIIATHALGRVGRWDDPNGHGTHVSGTALGNGANSGSQPTQHQYGGSFAGLAPEAGLVMQSLLDSNGGLGGVPADLNNLFQQAYDDGARVHSDSWGADGDQYGAWAEETDQFVWQHPDMNIVFAAGNAGRDANADGVVDSGSLGYQANAKNIISVGASESDRSSGGLQGSYGSYWNSDYPAAPLHNDLVSNNTNGIAAFSARGPAADGRFAPLLVNLGTNVLSARSHAPGAAGGWGDYNSDYLYDGGTSMAAPGVAGATALVREFYTRYAGVSPSAALVRATLLNSATDLNPGQFGTGATQEMTARPNNVEGWGRLNIASAFDLALPLQPRFTDNASGLAQSETLDYNLDVTDAGLPLHITLAWSDYPGIGLIDDLDLSLIAPNGTTLWGNGIVGGDALNNNETIDQPAAASGHYILRVSAPRIQAPNGRQPYALAVTAATGGAPLPTATPLPCGYFYDVSSSHAFYPYIHALACAGVVSGTSYGYYAPSGTATRAQFSRMVVVGFGLPILTLSSGYTFADVPPTHWAWPYIETAYANGIVSGISAGHFAPNQPVTRAQAVLMIVKARGWSLTTPTTADFADVSTSHWAYRYIETAYIHGAISGIGGGKFAPNARVTRGQLAKMLYNGVNLP